MKCSHCGHRKGIHEFSQAQRQVPDHPRCITCNRHIEQTQPRHLADVAPLVTDGDDEEDDGRSVGLGTQDGTDITRSAEYELEMLIKSGRAPYNLPIDLVWPRWREKLDVSASVARGVASAGINSSTEDNDTSVNSVARTGTLTEDGASEIVPEDDRSWVTVSPGPSSIADETEPGNTAFSAPLSERSHGRSASRVSSQGGSSMRSDLRSVQKQPQPADLEESDEDEYMVGY
ncbi:MAG: hypothetical protein M1823_002224 [Watsoniomyces obsoletus]|nr:MAG: hypothetical protein M1823_002224 [Watsoniomyces obsoletus]